MLHEIDFIKLEKVGFKSCATVTPANIKPTKRNTMFPENVTVFWCHLPEQCFNIYSYFNAPANNN